MAVRGTGERTIRAPAWRRRIFPTPDALAIALFVCVLAPTVLLALQIKANPKFSPIDEAAHFDYVDRVANGEVPRQGQRLQKSTLRELACRGSVLEGVKAPPCSTKELEYDQFSAIYQYEAQQPPTYYAITAPVRWLLQNLFGVDSKLDATRAAGIVWLVVGLLLAWAAGRVMGIAPLPLGSGLLLLVVAPTVLYGYATVTNDSTTVVAGGLVALVAALAYRFDGPRVSLGLFGAGFFAAATKTTNLFAVVAVATLFGVGAIAKRAKRERWQVTLRRWLRHGGALLLGAAIATSVWVIVHRSLSLIDLAEEPSFEGLRGDDTDYLGLLRGATQLLRPLTGGFTAFVPLSPDTLDHHVQAPFYFALSFLILAAALAGLFVSPRRWSHALGLIALPVLYVGGLLFGAAVKVSYDVDEPALTGRYGLSLAPLLVLVLAASLTGKSAERGIAIFAGAFFLTMLSVLLS